MPHKTWHKLLSKQWGFTLHVVVYDKIHADGYREMDIWVGRVFGLEDCFRIRAVAWMHNIPHRSSETRYLASYQPPSCGRDNLFCIPDATGLIHWNISEKYGMDVAGRCVEFKVVWLEAL